MDWNSLFSPFLRALDIPTKADIDAIEGRLSGTLESNNIHVLSELREHDRRVFEQRMASEAKADSRDKDNREWMERQFGMQFQKIDNFVAMLQMRENYGGHQTNRDQSHPL